MKVIGIIPARMASSRFPGKPMAPIQGIPMIGHCYFRSKMASLLDQVYVATCDPEIASYMEVSGGKAIMTSDKHERASDRIAEALLKIESQSKSRPEIVVMIQGDEPMVVPEMINLSVDPLLKDPKILISNLMADIQTDAEHQDPAEVKVVVDQKNFALYFSREPIPSRKKWSGDIPRLKQVCIIPFQRDFLLEYAQMEPTPLEKIESVDMNRILEHGKKILMVHSPYRTFSVDTPEDLRRVNQLMESDPLRSKYHERALPRGK